MKRALSIFGMLVLFTGLCSAQEGWVKQDPFIIKDYNDIYFLNADTGWIAGNAGTLLHSVNGGSSWEIINLPTNEWFSDLHFADNLTAWLVGMNGYIAKTTDGGQEWNTVSSACSSNINSIHFIDESSGWLAGDKGCLLSSNDGGDSWNILTPGTADKLRKVFFTDINNGWTVGGDASAVLKHTKNAGETWDDQDLPFDEKLFSLFFFDLYNGWVGGYSHLFYTTDIGESWQMSDVVFEDAIEDIFFINPQKGWLVAGNKIFHSADGGISWDLQEAIETNKSLHAITFVDEYHGWTCGESGTLYITHDGGGSTGIINVAAADISIYPNPSRGSLSIEFDQAVMLETVKVYSSQGQLVLNKEVNSLVSEYHFKMPEMAKGTYILKYSSNNREYSRKIIL